jgi:signal transduction histidine kinase
VKGIGDSYRERRTGRDGETMAQRRANASIGQSVERLRFAPAILARLGEELVPNPDLGVVELVRNAYDADAATCTVTLIDTEAPGGTIEIEDDGAGMSVADIRDGWLLLGQSQKRADPMTPGKRRKIGEKGLGRLAALRLGTSATLTTRQSASPTPGDAEVQHQVRLDWGAFDRAVAVEDVPLDLRSAAIPSTHSGTTIRIDGLKDAFAPTDVKRLARALVLLNGAFPAQNTFRASLDAPEFEQLAALVANGYFDQSEYVVTANVDDGGYASVAMTDWRGATIAKGDHSKLAIRSGSSDPTDVYACPAGRFELWAFILGAENFKLRNSTRTVAEVRDWLKEVGGVHLFQRDLRVHPYGDEGHDWLNMNLRRVRSPEGRPGTNTSVGRVIVNDEAGALVTKTDRSGFVENAAFRDLVRFCGDVLDWAADEQLKARDADTRRKATRVQRRKTTANKGVKERLAALPVEHRSEMEQAVVEFEEAVEEELKLVVNELQLYRALSTVGTTTAVFAHETVRPLAIIESMTDTVAYQLRTDLPDTYEARYAEAILLTRGSASALRTFAELPLRLLEADKRQSSIVDLGDRIERLLALFKFYLEEAGVELEVKLAAGATVRATISEIEAIVANMLANAVHFLSTAPTCDGGPKRVLVEAEVVSDAFVRINVADNGTGIRGIDPEDVWLPGRTTREGGTGLGLTIVRDVVADLDGRMEAIANGRLGGAEFTLTLPRTIQTEPEQLSLDDS